MSDGGESHIVFSDLARVMNAEFGLDKICEFTPEQSLEYMGLLEDFERTNSNPRVSSAEKGKSLERIAKFVLCQSGIFVVHTNVRTCTNEIDDIICLSPTGKYLCSNGILCSRYDNFIAECKNYQSSVSVTYTGKFCNLLLTHNIKLGVLFSYYGLSGTKWSASSGLVKKFYMCKENENDRYCIVDFSLDDFKRISNGTGFLTIIESKVAALRYDTDYRKFLSSHPSQE